jgi:hypothetical protein
MKLRRKNQHKSKGNPPTASKGYIEQDNNFLDLICWGFQPKCAAQYIFQQWMWMQIWV